VLPPAALLSCLVNGGTRSTKLLDSLLQDTNGVKRPYSPLRDYIATLPNSLENQGTRGPRVAAQPITRLASPLSESPGGAALALTSPGAQPVPVSMNPVGRLVPAAVRPAGQPVPAIISSVGKSLPAVISSVGKPLPALTSPVGQLVPAVANPRGQPVLASIGKLSPAVTNQVDQPRPAVVNSVGQPVPAVANPVGQPLPAALSLMGKSLPTSTSSIIQPVPAVTTPLARKNVLGDVNSKATQFGAKLRLPDVPRTVSSPVPNPRLPDVPLRADNAPVLNPPVSLNLPNVVTECPTQELAAEEGPEKAEPLLKKQRSISPDNVNQVKAPGGTSDTVAAQKGETLRPADGTWQLEWITKWANVKGGAPAAASSPPVEQAPFRGAVVQPATVPLSRTTSNSPERRADRPLQRGESLKAPGGRGAENGNQPGVLGSTGHFDWKAQLLAQWASTRPKQDLSEASKRIEGTAAAVLMPKTVPLSKYRPGGVEISFPGGGQKRARPGGWSKDGNEGSSGSVDSIGQFDWKAQWAILSARHSLPESSKVGGGDKPLSKGGGSGIHTSLLSRYASGTESEFMDSETSAGVGEAPQDPMDRDVSEATSLGGSESQPTATQGLGIQTQNSDPPQTEARSSGSFGGSLSALAFMKEMSDTFRKPPVGATRVLAHKASDMRSGEPGGFLRGFRNPVRNVPGWDPPRGENSFSWCVPSTEGVHASFSRSEDQPWRGGPASDVPGPHVEAPQTMPEPAPVWTAQAQSTERALGNPGEGLSMLGRGFIPPQAQFQPAREIPRMSGGASGVGSGSIHKDALGQKVKPANPALTKLVTEHLCSLLEEQAKHFRMVDPNNPAKLDPEQVQKLREQHAQMRAAISFLASLTHSGTAGLNHQEVESNQEVVAGTLDDASVSLVSPSTPGSASSPTTGLERSTRGGRHQGSREDAANGYQEEDPGEGPVEPLEGLQLGESTLGRVGGQGANGEGWHELGRDERLSKRPGVEEVGAGLRQSGRALDWAGLEELKAQMPFSNNMEWQQWLNQQAAGSAEPLATGSQGAPSLPNPRGEEHSSGHRGLVPTSSEAEQRFAQCFLTWPEDPQT
jgi:hypothetical protein